MSEKTFGMLSSTARTRAMTRSLKSYSTPPTRV